ncbi:MAG: hypothetical protein CVV00_11820 [Firmicutes bacterium HGW-Firmicutes-5]|nr:MAG: hypothetical protein CVV00_11820 [Firmicutes bacterium HGW-Firmicutes-5]
MASRSICLSRQIAGEHAEVAVAMAQPARRLSQLKRPRRKPRREARGGIRATAVKGRAGVVGGAPPAEAGRPRSPRPNSNVMTTNGSSCLLMENNH